MKRRGESDDGVCSCFEASESETARKDAVTQTRKGKMLANNPFRSAKICNVTFRGKTRWNEEKKHDENNRCCKYAELGTSILYIYYVYIREARAKFEVSAKERKTGHHFG